MREMARALVLQLLLAGVAAMTTHTRLTSQADDVTPSHLRGRASDSATPHSRQRARPIDEELAGAHLGQHAQHALTPPDGNGFHTVHRSARGQSLPAGTPDAAHERASSRAAHGQTPRHLSLERRDDCKDVKIKDGTDHLDLLLIKGCTEMGSLEVRARALVRPRPRSADRARRRAHRAKPFCC